jgi:hypothetical protein
LETAGIAKGNQWGVQDSEGSGDLQPPAPPCAHLPLTDEKPTSQPQATLADFAALPPPCARERTGAGPDLVVQALAKALAAWTTEPDAKRLRTCLIETLLLLEMASDPQL